MTINCSVDDASAPLPPCAQALDNDAVKTSAIDAAPIEFFMRMALCDSSTQATLSKPGRQ
jgi:hypothetical protein